jgi:hypothetical protein
VETGESRVPTIDSVRERWWSLVHVSLQGDMSCLNANATERYQYTSATVPQLEFYYPKYRRDPRFNQDKQILLKTDTELPRDLGRSNGECEESVDETGTKPGYTSNID